MKDFKSFSINEKYDKYLRQELKELGVEDEDLSKYVTLGKHGQLGDYLQVHGQTFTFGLLHAIFLDATNAKKLVILNKELLKCYLE